MQELLYYPKTQQQKAQQHSGKIFVIQKICEVLSPYGESTSQMHLYAPMSGEQEALAVVFRVSVKQFSHGAVFEHSADGAGQKRRD